MEKWRKCARCNSHTFYPCLKSVIYCDLHGGCVEWSWCSWWMCEMGSMIILWQMVSKASSSAEGGIFHLDMYRCSDYSLTPSSLSKMWTSLSSDDYLVLLVVKYPAAMTTSWSGSRVTSNQFTRVMYVQVLWVISLRRINEFQGKLRRNSQHSFKQSCEPERATFSWWCPGGEGEGSMSYMDTTNVKFITHWSTEILSVLFPPLDKLIRQKLKLSAQIV